MNQGSRLSITLDPWITFKMSYCKQWTFTLNNWSADDLIEISGWPSKYVVVGEETGESGTPHLQGYAIFEKRLRWTAVKKIHKRAHWEAAKGNLAQNYEYCTKDGIFHEYGEKPIESGEKEKLRWNEARAAAESGRMEDIPSDIFIRQYNALRSISKDYAPMPTDGSDVCGVWIYGPAGAGKSRKAREDYPGFYYKMCNKWWDGYKNEANVLIDDFDKGHSVLAHHLKIWSDRYAFGAEVKGGKINIRPTKIIITSQYSIEDIWEDQETRDALKRRFSVIRMHGVWWT